MENRDRSGGPGDGGGGGKNFYIYIYITSKRKSSTRATFKSRRIKERMLRRSREGPDSRPSGFPDFPTGWRDSY
jgi:hypothetical protein